MMLARHHMEGAITVREIASKENCSPKFLEVILLELKSGGIVESLRGPKGGYRLRRKPSDIRVSEILRIVDGPIEPLGDAEHLRELIAGDPGHRALYKIFLAVRDSTARILENTTITNIIGNSGSGDRKADTAAGGRKKTAGAMLIN